MSAVLEDALRRALETQAQSVEVSPDALGAIRARIARRRGWRAGRALFGIGAGATLAAAATVVAIVAGTASCVPAKARHQVAGPTPVATAQAPQTAAPAETAPPPGLAGLAVYYVGRADRLYREFHQVPAGASGADRIRAALAEMLRPGSALDPDYQSLWRSGTSVAGVSVSGRVATVDLSGATVAATDPAGQRAAVEQLVWTATQLPGIDGVLLRGVPGVATGAVLHRRPALDVLGNIWVIDPQQGMTVARHFTVFVDGTAFEAAAVVRIRDAAGTVILQRPIHVGSAGVPNRASVSLQLTLPPGTYTVEGFVFSMKDGSVQDLDDHVFTVR